MYVSNQGGLWPIRPFFNVKSLKKYYSIVVVDEIDEAKNLSLSWEKRGGEKLSLAFFLASMVGQQGMNNIEN